MLRHVHQSTRLTDFSPANSFCWKAEQLHVLQAGVTFVLFGASGAHSQEDALSTASTRFTSPPPLSPSHSGFYLSKTADRGSPIPPDIQCSSCLVYHTDSDFFSGPTLITTQLLHCSCLAHNGISTKVCIPLLSGEGRRGRGVQERAQIFLRSSRGLGFFSIFDQTDRQILFAYV